MRKVFLLAGCLAMLSSCITTGPAEPEKWAPEKRAETHVQLGMTYLRKNQYETANKEFDMALAINPKSDTAHHAKGLVLAQIGDNEQAKSYFSKAVSLNPKNFLAVNDYAIHLCQQGETAQGIEQLQRVEKIPANNRLPDTHLGLGICYLRANRSARAEGYLRTVLQENPTLPQALLPMAEISVLKSEFLTARAFLERYFGTGVYSERSLYLAATVEHQLGDDIKANQYRRALKKAFPTSSYSKKLEELLE